MPPKFVDQLKQEPRLDANTTSLRLSYGLLLLLTAFKTFAGDSSLLRTLCIAVGCRISVDAAYKRRSKTKITGMKKPGADDFSLGLRKPGPIFLTMLSDSLRREIGQHFVVGFHGQEVNDDIRRLIQTYFVGSVILMKRNVKGMCV